MPLLSLSSTDADTADAGELLRRHPVHVIYKHSPTCSLSEMAHDEVREYADRSNALPLTLIDVFEARAMSDALEAETGIRHESPQVLLVRNGRVQWHASHRRVTARALDAAANTVVHG